ncbi:MAG: VOC family protein [Bacteroidales bacterium]|nr:VOC family protein [Bacteroidales bacterium]
MSKVSTYLNFPGNAWEAFNFYKSVFGGEFLGDVVRMKDMPGASDSYEIPENEKNLIMHIELPITGGHILMASDVPPSMGFNLTFGNHVSIMVEPDSKEETDRLFNGISKGGEITSPLQDMFWGAYYGTCSDKFGVNWMFNFYTK